FLMRVHPPRSTLFPYTTLFRSNISLTHSDDFVGPVSIVSGKDVSLNDVNGLTLGASTISGNLAITANGLVSDSGNLTVAGNTSRSEEHTSELQSLAYLVCRLLL